MATINIVDAEARDLMNKVLSVYSAEYLLYLLAEEMGHIEPAEYSAHCNKLLEGRVE